MLQEFKDRIIDLKQDITEEIRKKELPKEVSIRCDDPYDPEEPSVEIYEIRKTGVIVKEYIEIIDFSIWSIETLVCILEEIEREEE